MKTLSSEIINSAYVTTNSNVVSKFENLSDEVGFDYFAITHISAANPFNKNEIVTKSLNNFSDNWIETYTAKRFVENDPIIAFAPRSTNATDWSKLKTGALLTKDQKGVMNMASDHGIRSGVFLSARQFNGGQQLISFSSSFDRQFSDEELATATAVGTVIALQLADENRSSDLGLDIALSDRERECLTWAAIGKSSTEIETIVGISRNTVDFHIKNAMEKLDAASRTFAIVKAIRLGLINP